MGLIKITVLVVLYLQLVWHGEFRFLCFLLLVNLLVCILLKYLCVS